MPRLLLVEDEQVNRDLFRRRLERKGYTVIPAESGLQAVELTKSEKPDLVLMDLGLPDIDGWEATKRIKADATVADIPIIVLSAHATTEARARAFAAGCEEFETKPVNWDAVFKKIEEALKKAEEWARAKAAAAAPATKPPKPADDDEIDFGGSSEPDPNAVTGVLQSGKNKLKDAEKEVCVVHPKTILVVEDNDANRVMLCRRLNKHGYRTVEAANGRQALDALAKQRFDLVLCDIMMPDVDGYEVLKEMKADPDLQAVPIIMISALDEMASVVRCIEMGAEDYLQKPYDPVLLHARINACLDKRRLRDQELDYLRAVADLTKAAEAVERGTFQLSMLSVVAERDDTLGTLARVFANMAYQVKAREEQLRNDVQKLVAVEVDHREVTQEVARVTSSESFDKARRRADEARARRQRIAAPKPGAETMILPKPPPR
jgi:CheY-like chemotaxis protein